MPMGNPMGYASGIMEPERSDPRPMDLFQKAADPGILRKLLGGVRMRMAWSPTGNATAGLNMESSQSGAVAKEFLDMLRKRREEGEPERSNVVNTQVSSMPSLGAPMMRLSPSAAFSDPEPMGLMQPQSFGLRNPGY